MREDLERTITGSPSWSVRARRERLLLRTLPRSRIRRAKRRRRAWTPSRSRRSAQNRYSVPASLAGLKIRARIGASEISFWHDGKVVAAMSGCTAHYRISAQLDHYLDLLARKPGALARSLALRQERDRGGWPECFDELWTAIQERSGASGGRPADGRRAAALPRAPTR